MQNLTLTNYQSLEWGLGQVKAQCHNELSCRLYIVDSHNNLLTVDYQAHRIIMTQKLDEDIDIVNMTYLVDQDCLCIIGHGGSIYKFTDKQELIAEVESKITAAGWSPSQQYLLLVTENGSMIQINSQFDIVKEIELDDTKLEAKGTECSMSWKADGKFVCINYQVGDGRKCLTRDIQLNVFKSPAASDPDEKGLVQSVSDKPVARMGKLVAWMPSGAIIAGFDRIGDAHRVIFWQKNGLRHLEFNLPQIVKKVNNLSWSLDSQILFVQVEMVDHGRRLLAYHRANYHWYLKTSLLLDASAHYFVARTRKNHLLILSPTKLEDIEMNLETSPSRWISRVEQDKVSTCLHYVVDGNTVHITDFSKGLIPPPMCHHKIQLSDCVEASAIKNNHILLVTSKQILLWDHGDKKFLYKFQNHIHPSGRLWRMHLHSAFPLRFSIGNQQFEGQTIVKECQPYDDTKVKINLHDIEVQLEHNKLRVNGKTISQECTSFCVYDKFLLFTNNSVGMYQKLYTLNLELQPWIWNGEVQDLVKGLPADESKSLHIRMVERGSKIISCSLGRVIFQLPRGNLEAIHPKIIVLSQVSDKLKHMQYYQGFELLRTHKLDLNLLFDMYPEQFVEKSHEIVRHLSKPDYINLFVAHLKEGASQELKYCFTNDEVDNKKMYISNFSSKIELICRKTTESLRTLDPEKYLLSIFTSEVKKGDLPSVLREIKEMRKSEGPQKKIPPHLQQQKTKKKISTREILEYVCWLADAQALYNVSLLTYDLQLVAMCAEFTQKDPKEYVPYLEELKAISDEVNRRKRICLDLKNYNQAIEQLAQGSLEQRDEALRIIQQHSLFKKGVMVFQQDRKYLVEVKCLLAEHLLKKEEINEAISILESCHVLDRALKIALSHFKIKRAIGIMETMGLQQTEIRNRVAGLIPNMIQSTADPKELCRAYEYVRQYEHAFKIAVKHDLFKRASRILKCLSADFILTVGKDTLKLAYSLKNNEVGQLLKNYNQKFNRLQIVQRDKKASHGLGLINREADEMYSEYSSSVVSQSNYTVSTTTGMKKKKQKVKGILSRNVKEGSPIEQDHIIAFLSDISQKSQDLFKQCKLLIQLLIHADLYAEAQTLRNQVRTASQIFTKRVRPIKETKYEEDHPDVLTIYPPYVQKQGESLNSFDYLF